MARRLVSRRSTTARDEAMENNSDNEAANDSDVEMEDAANENPENQAAAAAAAARAPEHNNQEPSLLEQLLGRIRNYLGNNAEAHIDEDQARRLLEAGAGDLDVVTNLFLDHYFASLGNRRSGGSRRREANDENNEEESSRRVRRRLEEQLEEQAELDQQAINENMQENQEEGGNGGGGEGNHPDRPVEENEDNDDDDEPADMPPPALPENRRRAGNRPEGAAARVQADGGDDDDDDDDDVDDDNNGEGAAVSDDEGLFQARRARLRLRSRRQPQDGRNEAGGDAPLLRNISIEVGSELEDQLNEVMRAPLRSQNQVSVKKEEEDESFEDDLDDDFLTDHDWIFQNDSNTSPVLPPVLLLWGDPTKPPESTDGSEDNNGPPVAEGNNNIVEDDEDGDDDDDVQANEPPKEGIPKTWLRAGFTPSSCGTGLVTLPPEEESVLHRLRQSQNSGARNIAPPPYHCRGVTALLSVVTALMYSGASIQGSTVDCTGGRTPFAQLSEEERKREFDIRLVDALSALLLIAAKTSLERKKRALAKRKLTSSGSTEADKRLEQIVERRMRLIPTCRFEGDLGTGDGTLTEGQLVQIATSYTSMEDIRAYVISTLRSFTKKGGCALFLETIIRIHGKACVDRMLRISRRKANLPATEVLIECECEKRQKKLSQMPYGATNQPVEEPLQLDHSCISTELVSLLLTGEVRSNFQGWDTGGLGIGFLSMEPGEIGRGLMHPQKPVWVLRGDTCYTVAWLEKEEHEDSVSRGERPGTLHHWNSWFGNRNKSTMRLMTARREWRPPVFSKVRAVVPERKTLTEAIMARRRAQSSHLVSSDESPEDEKPSGTEPDITKDEIDQVTVNPDDKMLFPNEFRQWRFDMGHPTPPEKVKEEDDVKMGPASSCGKEHLHWTPYFRLDDRQKRIVDMKMSPKIKRILWTRWPGATIDRMTPEDDDMPPAV